MLRLVSRCAVGALLAMSAVAQVKAQDPQYVTPSSEEIGNEFPGNELLFGWDVAVRGDTALFSMPDYGGENNFELDGFGRVAVFSRNASGAWGRTATVEANDRAPGDNFGLQVALADRVALIGANSGVYVFRRASVDGPWVQAQKITPQVGEVFGALALGNGVAFIQVNALGQAGSVRVLIADRTGRFVRTQRLTAPDGAAGNGFGDELAIEKDTLVVGAAADRERRGAAYVFTHLGPVWFPLQKLIAINGEAGDLFGASVAIGDGVIAVGAPDADPSAEGANLCFIPPSGRAYVFTRRFLLWSQSQDVERVAHSEPCVTSFASDIAVNKRWLVTGSPSFYPWNADGGTLFERTGGVFRPVAPLYAAYDGSPVVRVSGATAVVAIPIERGFVAGSAMIYELTAPP
jgi:hypothetical protein